MPNVVAIISDDRARRQCEQYLQELGLEDLRFATFKNHQEFTNLYWRDRTVKAEAPTPDATAEGATAIATTAPSASPPADEDGADLKLFSEIHMVIFALDSIGEKSGPWIDKLRLNFKKFGFMPTKSQLRLILLKYEDDNITKLEVLHPHLDDLVYLPLDRLIFLQKTEIFLALPKRVKPRFLFNQEMKAQIEISKISKMDRLSDVGLAIRNPIPLRKGLPGHFYIHLPGEKNPLEIRGKVFRSDPHPEYPGQYLVYFTYFGLPKSDLSKIRQALSKAPRYQSLYSDDRSLFSYKPDDLFASSTEFRSFGVAVVDSDEQVLANLPAQLNKDMDRLKIMTDSSFQMFLIKNFETGDNDKTPSRPTETTDFFAQPLRLTISKDNLNCVSVDPQPSTETEMILGHLATDLFATPEKWLSLFPDKSTRLVLEETLNLTASGRELERMLTVSDSAGNRCYVKFTFKRSETDGLVDASLTPVTLADLATLAISKEQNKDLDLLILEANFIPEEPASWIEGLRSRAVQVGMCKTPAQLKFIALADDDRKANGPWLQTPDILGLMIKPVDSRQLQFLMAEYLPNTHTMYNFDNLGWSQPSLSVHVSKNVDLEALSEFGTTLRSKQPLAPGTMIYLRKSIYDNAPNSCLAARVYSCEPHSQDKGYFQVYVTYFGINDQFLKFARTWIRENYAHQKGKEGGG